MFSTLLAIETPLENGKVVPHIVSITDQMRYTDHIGSGSILNSRYIISGAHSLQHVDPNTLTVVANAQQTWDWSNPEIVRYGVDKIVIHPSFNTDSRENDIGLLHTTISIVFNDRVQPISLSQSTLTSQDVVMSAFGLTDSHSTFVPLAVADFTSISNDDCKVMLGSANAEMIFESKVCVLPKDGRVICRNDYGAPLTSDNQLAGVTSWNVPCAHNSPIVLERISSHLDFINTNIV